MPVQREPVVVVKRLARVFQLSGRAENVTKHDLASLHRPPMHPTIATRPVICNIHVTDGTCGATGCWCERGYLASWKITPSVYRFPERTRLTPWRMFTR